MRKALGNGHDAATHGHIPYAKSLCNRLEGQPGHPPGHVERYLPRFAGSTGRPEQVIDAPAGREEGEEREGEGERVK
jgi:hypothetical protein